MYRLLLQLKRKKKQQEIKELPQEISPEQETQINLSGGGLGSIFGESEDERYKLLRDFYVKENVDAKTKFKGAEPVYFQLAEYVDKTLKTNWNIDIDITWILDGIKFKRISDMRLGRTEAIDVLKRQELEDDKIKDKVARLFGAS